MTEALRMEDRTAVASGQTHPMAMSDGLFYVFGVTAAADWTEAWPRLDPLVEGAVTVAVPAGGLIALCAYLDTGTRQALQSALADQAQARGIVVAHDAWTKALAKSVALLPCRLCTVFSSADGVYHWLSQQEGDLTDRLIAIRGALEYTVDFFPAVDAVDPPEPSAEALAGQSAGQSAGRAYLQGRRAVRERRRRSREEGAATLPAIADLHAKLAALSRHALAVDDYRQRALQPAARRGVYLIDRSREAAFGELAATVQAQGAKAQIEIKLTGPWPAYHFAGFRQAGTNETGAAEEGAHP